MRKTKILLGLIVVFVCLNALVWYLIASQNAGVLTVAFLNVGQGDAIFIEAPNGNQVLIDAGEGERVLESLAHHMSFFDRSIDMLIITHPHRDHLGGMFSVLTRYRVGMALTSGNESSSSLEDLFHRRLKEQGITYRKSELGMVIDLGGGVVFEIIAPFAKDVKSLDPNTASVVGKLSYGKISFLLTGDAPKKIERYLVFRYGQLLSSDILKAGHHGSDTSSGALLLSAVDPKFTVVSAGIPNNYGHPNPQTIARILQSDSKILHTVKQDGVVFQSDGIHLVVKK